LCVTIISYRLGLMMSSCCYESVIGDDSKGCERERRVCVVFVAEVVLFSTCVQLVISHLFRHC
jgi:hypothetical protein